MCIKTTSTTEGAEKAQDASASKSNPGGLLMSASASPLSPGSPQHELAVELSRELDVNVNPTALRLFIKHRWDTIAKLAHAVHGTKPITAADVENARAQGKKTGAAEERSSIWNIPISAPAILYRDDPRKLDEAYRRGREDGERYSYHRYMGLPPSYRAWR